MKTLFHSHELVLTLVLIALCAMVAAVNPAFLSLSNLFDMLKSSSVMGIFAVGVLVVLISGGIDISFTAIAALCMYVTSRTLVHTAHADSMIAPFVLAGTIGFGLGMFNAIFIAFFRLPTLIVTLGTAAVFRGFMLAFVGTQIVNTLPPGMVAFSKWTIFNRLDHDETVGLSIAPLIFAATAVSAWLALRYTVPGRGVYALGGNPEGALRSGLSVRRMHFGIYGLIGCLSGVAGVIHAATMRNANPFDLVGTELNVIAAAVLGGASITGGRGTVAGVVLGVLLIVVMNNSLIMLGIPTYFQRVAIGVIILVGTGLSARRGEHGKGILG